MLKIVKRYFEKGIYSVDDVKKFVRCAKITEEEFKEITGEEYIQ